MPDLDFNGLRADVESATLVPDFDAVRRRARRLRLRDRIVVVLALIALGGVVTPVTLAAMRGGPGPSVLVGPDRPPVDVLPSGEGTSPMTATRFQATVRAIAGADLDHLYAAVDVCAAEAAVTNCDLQVSLVPLASDRQRSPVVIGQLRTSAASPLTDVQLSVLTNRSLLLSGVPSTGPRAYARINVPQSLSDYAGGASEPSPPSGYTGALSPGDHGVQLTEHGDLYGVRAVDDRLTRLTSQPPLEKPVLATGVAPENGWWVTGLDLITGGLAVSVSHDQGRSWTTRRLGTAPGADDAPAVATVNGTTAYVFVHTTNNAVIALRTTDAGQDWHVLNPPVSQLPEHLTAGSARVGALIRPDGSVLMWVEDGTAPMYMESGDGGASFHGVSGPGGRMVAVAGGYAVVSTPPAISRDARTWTVVPVPAYLPPG